MRDDLAERLVVAMEKIANKDEQDYTWMKEDVVRALEQLSTSFQSGMVMPSNPYDWEMKEQMRRGADHQENMKYMMQNMEDFFREMAQNMRDEKYRRQDEEMKRQQELLDRQIKINRYTEDQKKVWYSWKGYESKMEVSYKKAS